MALYGVIIAGGSGSRFWPSSRAQKPKQLLKLFSDKPMITETVERLTPLIPEENTYIATNQSLADHIKKELPQVHFVIEPAAKNTAAAIGLSVITLLNKDPESVMFIETADHVYKDVDEYLNVLKKGVLATRKNKIVLLGIQPTTPNTNYGYIQPGEEFDEDIPGTFVIDGFKEKPDLKTAKEFVEKGFLWNSGTFMAKCSIMLAEIKQHMPTLYDGLKKIQEHNFKKEIIEEVFDSLESISIDHGIMEPSTNTIVIKADMGWDDIGDYLALERYFPKDEHKNVLLSEFEGNAENCIVLSKKRKVKAIDVQGLIIVDTEDATLIADKRSLSDMKKVMDKIKEVELDNYIKDTVTNHTKQIISYDSENCHVETDGLIVFLGVHSLEVVRTATDLTIEGTEQL